VSELREVNVLTYNADIKRIEISIKRRDRNRIMLKALNIINKDKNKILFKGAP
jgi:hypothetical protein